jgi:hypothetical protein
MKCSICDTELTKYNTTNSPGVHDRGNCMQILLVQRDAARQDALEEARHCKMLRADLAVSQLAAVDWEDRRDEWSDAISKAHPARDGKTEQDHDRYGVAMRMVSNRHSKGALVALVNWLLAERDAARAIVHYTASLAPKDVGPNT